MQRDVITRNEALNAGLSEDAIFRRVKSEKWQLLFPGIYLSGPEPPSWEQLMFAACQWAGPLAVASHESAARLYRFPGFENAGLELTVPRNLSAGKRPVIIHRVQTVDKQKITKVGRIPATTPTWTIVNLATVLDFFPLQRITDYAISQDVTTWRRLEKAAEAGFGEPGIPKLRKILKAGQAAESLLQRGVMRLLVESRLPTPSLEYPEGQYRIDLAYPDRRLAIETDGYESHSGREAFGKDRIKQNHLILMGWTVLRFTWDDLINRPDYIVATVASFLAAAIGPKTGRSSMQKNRGDRGFLTSEPRGRCG
jgi:very-short-patch-repair endonuclease